MPVLPSSLEALLFLFAGAFGASTFESFQMLVLGFLSRIGEHSVCGMLQAARLERSWHHSRAHAFFATRKWCPDELGLLLLDFLIATFLEADAPIKLAVDDSLFSRTGEKVFGAAWQYDGSAPSGQGPKLGFGNNWVILTLIVRLPFMKRAVSLPVLARLWVPDPDKKKAPKRKRNPAYPSKSELSRRMLDLVVARYPSRKVKLVADSAYATRSFRGVGENVMLTSRLKSNARLYAPKPPPSGKRGQPAKKGPRLAKLKAIADERTTRFEQIEVSRSGRRQQVLVHSFQALFYDVWGERAVRIVLVRSPRRKQGYDIALITMNMTAGPAEVIEDYDERWSIEVCIEDAKQITGVGEARNRVELAVRRTVPFGLFCQTLTITWYALCGNAERDVERARRHARWYRHKRNPSYQDMLCSLRRAIIAAQYLPVTPRTGKPGEIRNSASALSAATG